MALSASNYPNPCDPANPLGTAYVWATALNLDLFTGSGSVTFNVNPNTGAAYARPLDQFTVYFGQDLGGPIPMVGLAELMQIPDFKEAFDKVGAYIYQAAAASHPLLLNAPLVP